MITDIIQGLNSNHKAQCSKFNGLIVQCQCSKFKAQSSMFKERK